MFVQGSQGTIKVNVSLSNNQEENISILENSSVTIKFKKKDKEFIKECIIVDYINSEAMCYLDANDLDLAGNYEYQVIITYSNGNIIKSFVNSFYVQPSL